MAFTLRINSKGLFSKAKSIDFDAIIKNCKLEYGSANEFYVMNEGEKDGETAILYNPDRIGRGIFFDSEKVSQGEITVSYNIPTTASEIRDFISVVKEIVRQFGKASLYSEEEEREFTTTTLENNASSMIEFSRQKLNEFCRDQDFAQCILTLAKIPWYLDADKREQYKYCTSLDDFEETIHELQKCDVYYAKPSLYRNQNDGKILAYYTLTNDCESCFPINPESFINLDNIKIDEAFIRFYFYEEDKILDDFYPYARFIDFVKEKGAVKFDAEHLRIPDISKEEIYEFIKL